jgi:histidine triad (HIT) family protein
VVTGCVFCGIVAGTEPAEITHEWGDAIAFVPIDPVIAGHTLVVPRTHVRNAVENQVVTAMTMVRAVELAARHDASNILTSIGAAAAQSVMHLHIHVIPRHDGDQLMLPWGTTGDPHETHRCKGMDLLETEIGQLRLAALPATMLRPVSFDGSPEDEASIRYAHFRPVDESEDQW